MIQIKKINHIGIAVRNIEKSIWFWNNVLGLPLTNIEEVPSYKVNVAFLKTGESKIELLMPMEGNAPPEKIVLEKGGGLDHLYLEVEDVKSVLDELRSKGVKLINQTAIELPGRKVAFGYP